MPGRKTKLNAETTELIVQAVRIGNYLDVAAACAGIAPSTLYRWLQLGEDGKAPYREFRESLTRARAQAEVRAVAQLHVAMQGGQVLEDRTETRRDGSVVRTIRTAPIDTQAAKFLLERSFGERWGRRNVLPAPDPETQVAFVTDADAKRLTEHFQRWQEARAIDGPTGDDDNFA